MRSSKSVVAIGIAVLFFIAFIVPADAVDGVNTSLVPNGPREGMLLPDLIESTYSSSEGSLVETTRDSGTSVQGMTLEAGAVASGTNPAIEWQRVIGAPHTEDLPSIRQTTDGGYVACGLTDVYYPDGDIIVPRYYGNGDMWLVKMDASGNIVWQNVFGGYGRDECRSVRQTNDGGYVLVGISNSTNGEFAGKNHGGYDIYVVKTDGDGDKIWQSLIGEADNDVGIGIRQTSDGGYLITGYSDHSNGKICQFSTNTDAWVAKLNAAGNLSWKKMLGGDGGDQGTSVVESPGGYIMYGFSSSNNSYSQNHGVYDLWLAFLSSDGIVMNERLYGGSGFEATGNVHDDGIQLTSDGGVILLGQTSTNKNGDVGFNHGYNGDIWVVKFDSNGQIQWQKTFGGWNSEGAGGIFETPDGEYVFSAVTYSSDSGDVDTNHGSSDIWVVKIDKNGDLIKQIVIGGNKGERGGTIQPTADGGYILSGGTLSSSSGDVGNNHMVSDGWPDGWVVKLRPKSLDVPDDVKRYAPNVQFDSDENFYPTSPFFYTEDIYETSGEGSKNNYLNMNLNQKMDNFTVYYRVVDTPIHTVYQYWYYYVYNDWLNQHYHDWEKTYVFVNKNTGKINVTVADAHEWWCPNSQLENPGVDHLGILAEMGGHAFAIDANEDGSAQLDEVNYQPSYQEPLFGGFGSSFSGNVKYGWSPGMRMPASDIQYQLREISPGFIRKFQNEPEFPNSPTLGFIKIIYPILGKDYVFEIGGKSATLPWKSPEYENPDKIIKRVETIIKGIVSRNTEIPDDSPSTVAVFSDSPKWTFTNRTGYFEMINIEPGTHEVVVNAEGYAPYVQKFFLEENANLGVNGTMNMYPESEAFRIVGYVQNQSGSVADNITIDIYDNTNTRVLTTLSDENGTFISFVSEKSDYRVVATTGSETGSAHLKGVAGSIVGGNVTLGTDRTWPVANFTASVTWIPNYQYVQFNDTSENMPETWYWDFGDGTNSTEQNPNHLYRTVGNFTVNFTAANDLGSTSVIRAAYINVYNAGLPPVAIFTSNFTSSTGPFYPVWNSTVQFTDQSQASGNNTSWFWDFGDGTNSTEQNPVHTLTYRDIWGWGGYESWWYVNLTVTDEFGRTSQASQFVIVFNDYHMDFIGEPSSGPTPLEVNFTELPDEIPEDWVWWRQWDFGDGSSYDWYSWDENGTIYPPLKNITHAYASPGNYTVTLYKQYNEMGYYSKTKEHYIHVGGDSGIPVADFTANTTSGDEPLAISFLDQSTNSPNTWSWTFGDGTSSAEQDPIHIYNEAGAYTVSLTAANNDGSNTTIKKDYIRVLPTAPPVADFSANVTFGYSPLPVSFTDLSTNAPVNWTWDFGDGTTSTERNPEHIFELPGNYTVSLVVMNDYGSDSGTRTEYITVVIEIPEVIPDPEGPPFAEFTANTTYGKAPLAVEFSDLTRNATSRWNWTFGDGGTSAERFPVYTYSDPGTYSVSLSAGNTYGENSTTREDYITVVPVLLPDANFTAVPTAGKPPLSVTFSDTSTGSPTRWFWDFGDGTTSTEQNPVHEYSAAGGYTVSLTATNDDGSDTETRPDLIIVAPFILPVADFTANVTSGNVPLAVEFTDISPGSPTSWSWSFGDGGISSDQNPVHTYTVDGQFTVTLKVTNGDGSNTTTKEQFVTASVPVLPVAEFSANTTSGNVPLAVGFTDESTGSPESWLWDFGDGTTSNEQNPEHVYTGTGNFPVSLTVTNPDGSNTTTKTEFINVTSNIQPPVADFTGKPTCGKAPLSVTFTDSSTGNPKTWFWDFGDGTNATNRNPVHIYTSGGKYAVSLTAANAGGSDTKTRIDYISVSGTVRPPVANFYGKPTTGKAPLSVKFTDTSTGGPASWFWDFGDGSNATDRNPVHSYAVPGKYAVSLTVRNSAGSNMKTRAEYITVKGLQPPVANFYGKPTSGKVPLSVKFTDASAGNPTTWLWDFGDGSTSVEKNPAHRYVSAGKYTVSLTASNTAGSTTKTRTQYITVKSATPTPTPTHTCTSRPTTTCTTKPTTTSTSTNCAPYEIPSVTGTIENGKIRLGWDAIANPCLQGYKVVIAKKNPNPEYPDDGYMFWITDRNTNYAVVSSTDHYNGGDFGGYLRPGQRYYFSVTAIYSDAKVAGNAIMLEYPA